MRLVAANLMFHHDRYGEVTVEFENELAKITVYVGDRIVEIDNRYGRYGPTLAGCEMLVEAVVMLPVSTRTMRALAL